MELVIRHYQCMKMATEFQEILSKLESLSITTELSEKFFLLSDATNRDILRTECKKEVRRLGVIILLVLVYAIGIVCVLIMKKLQPENVPIYAIWVVVVCVLLTVFVVIRVSWE